MNPIILKLAMAPVCVAAAAPEQGAIDIGSRLELFVDDHLIETMSGNARLQLHRPVPREVVFRTDTQWEGNASSYQTVFKDGDLYKMYYRGGHYKHGGEPAHAREPHPWVLCYAESDDGISWRRPELGIREYEGSTANNIVLDTEMMAAFAGCPAHTAVFIDRNPECPADQKVKIIAYGSKPHGLYALGSPDGLNFRVLSETAIQTDGAFDSQNLVFWDTVRGEYRMYHRGFSGAVRDVLTATSRDILSFPKPEWLSYPGSPTMALYTNQIQPYYRAPHIFMGFPMRYNERGWSGPMLDLPGRRSRLERAKHHPRYGMTVTDAVFMTSRDGTSFHRRPEAFIRPGPRRKESWVYGDNFVFWGMFETASSTEDAPPEISFLAVEGYWEGEDTAVRRYTLRIDDFVSAHAPFAGGELITVPLVFDGGALAVNAETSAFGSFQVEIQHPDGTPVQGFELGRCEPVFCDSLRHVVHWSGACDVGALAGKPVQLRILLRDADIYSFQFVSAQPARQVPDIPSIGIIPPKNPARAPFVVVEDDFQGAKPGAPPLVGDGDRGWKIIRPRPEVAQVLAEGGNHYLELTRGEGGPANGGRAWATMLPQDAADTTDGTVELSARFRVPSTNRSCVGIDAYDSPPEQYANRAFHARFWPDGTVSHYARPKAETREEEVTPADMAEPRRIDIPELHFIPGEWLDVTIHADLRAATFDLTVAGATVRALPFAHQSVHRVQCIAFCPETDNCTLHVDSVRITVKP